MKSIDWKGIAELIGITAIVASLVFLSLQTRQSQAIANAETYGGALMATIEGSNAIIGNVDVWVRGSAGGDLNANEEAIFARLVLNENDRSYFAVQQLRELDLEDLAELEVATYAGFLFENPGALKVWRARNDWLRTYRRFVDPAGRITPDWAEAVEGKLALFLQSDEPIDE